MKTLGLPDHLSIHTIVKRMFLNDWLRDRLRGHQSPAMQWGMRKRQDFVLWSSLKFGYGQYKYKYHCCKGEVPSYLTHIPLARKYCFNERSHALLLSRLYRVRIGGRVRIDGKVMRNIRCMEGIRFCWKESGFVGYVVNMAWWCYDKECVGGCVHSLVRFECIMERVS
jgi:hypothetical protein